jgi:hypothetical protein
VCHSIPVVRASQQAIPNHCTPKTLGAGERLALGVQAIAGHQSIAGLAEQAKVSRKFVHHQPDIAQAALHDAFAPTADHDKVRFQSPVAKNWLKQAALGLTRSCHSSCRGVHEFNRDFLDVRMAAGWHRLEGQARPFTACSPGASPAPPPPAHSCPRTIWRPRRADIDPSAPRRPALGWASAE